VQPTGTVTLLFTDVEGSTRLLSDLGAERYADLLGLHRRLLRGAFEAHDGYEVDEEGDAFLVAFPGAGDAVAAARDAQHAMATETWPGDVELRVRMGLHTGEPLPVPPKYVGMDVHRAARIMAAAHGGQVVVSEATAALLDAAPLRDLGAHRLKDLLAPIRLYQLEIEGLPGDFPPLRSLHRSNLPVAAWPLLGRERELDEILMLVAESVRLVTLTGAGGSGKTRLALQAAAELSDVFDDGVFFVALSPLRDLSTVRATVAESVGLQADDDIVSWLGSKRVLLVLDNLEHLPGVESIVWELLEGETVVLATSRAPLHLSTERELPVEPLRDESAMELFVSRAAAAGRGVEPDDTVRAVCRRLDNLPLALELAAARAKLLAPTAMLQRLDAALPLLTGGAHDLPERQRTLRATIEWSHDLLDQDVQAAFRRLSVFRGSFTLDAAEAVADADLDQVATLLDQSLLKPLGEERFFLLETIREYARERLDVSGERDEYTARHARFYLARLDANRQEIWGSRWPELLAWYEDEEDNLRAALDLLTVTAVAEAARAARRLHVYWLDRRAYAEEEERIRSIVARDDLGNQERAALLGCLAEVALRIGDVRAQEAAAREGLGFAEPGTLQRARLLIDLGLVAVRGGRPEEAVSLAHQIIDAAEHPLRALDADSPTDRQVLGLRFDAANILGEAGHTDDARALMREIRDEFRRTRDENGDAVATTTLAQFDLYDHDYEAARDALTSTLATARRLGRTYMEAEALRDLGYSLLGLGRRDEARAAFLELLDLATQDGLTVGGPLADSLDGIALTADHEDAGRAVCLRAAIEAMRRAANLANSPMLTDLERDFEQPLVRALGQEQWEDEHAAGVTMTVEETIQLARLLAAP
jgi:predicted ATPase/class 3 adenylate cyclase